ncbi:hypothetical protein CH341_04470 [Rhodoplanes roseus]|uniref:Integrase n=2 Tax=Rhodoplanes roseus TaxID=29409 RepID=A0A327L576_9BRAD|nr:hypothetical protein CH341_04470 [Rhodoplanes roseus]
MRLTRSGVTNLTLAPGRPYQIFWDEALRGFGVRVNPTGKVWVVQYRIDGKSRRETIGRVDTVPLDLAREEARKTLARVQLGENPREERARAKAQRALVLEAVIERYLQQAKTRLKSRSLQEVERHLRKHWRPLHETPLSALDRRVLALRLEEIARDSGPIASNRARAALSALLSYALSMGLLETNPLVGTFKAGEEIRRDHVLTDQELQAVWTSSENSDYGRAVKLLTLTGQRREEVGSMRWAELDLPNALWTIPSARTKNGLTHEVPLSSLAVKLLSNTPQLVGRDLVFGAGAGGYSGWSKAKRDLDERIARSAALRPWRLHDLRRTVATGMANLGVQPHVVEAVLNHISGTRGGVAGIYNRATYREEKTRALEVWSEHVSKLTNGG